MQNFKSSMATLSQQQKIREMKKKAMKEATLLYAKEQNIKNSNEKKRKEQTKQQKKLIKNTTPTQPSAQE